MRDSKFSVIALVMLVAACGSSGTMSIGGDGGACPGAGAKCGATCTGDLDCGAGFYCAPPTGMCTADCTGTGGCNIGQVCDGRGRCVTSSGGGDGGVGDGGNTVNLDAACAVTSSTATLIRPPVDIILIVDNSGSMTNEIVAIQNNINMNFASIIGASGLDYRVILLARHGSAANGQSICIDMPLSGNATCTPPPAMPTNTSRFFHYSVEIGSHNSLSQIIATYHLQDEFNLAPMGWQAWLRPGAAKTFIEITDDESTTLTSANFETMLFALMPKMFGDANNRGYTFHSIIGMHENNPATSPWLPADPVQMTLCTGNGGDVVAPGIQYQNLSKISGGLRFPLCEYTSFDVVFKKVADGVVTGSMVACDFAIPTPPMGTDLDLNKVAVSFTPGTGSVVQFNQVTSLAACVPNAFYIANNKIVLCPASCTTVQADPKAKVDVLYTCSDTIIG